MIHWFGFAETEEFCAGLKKMNIISKEDFCVAALGSDPYGHSWKKRPVVASLAWMIL